MSCMENTQTAAKSACMRRCRYTISLIFIFIISLIHFSPFHTFVCKNQFSVGHEKVWGGGVCLFFIMSKKPRYTDQVSGIKATKGENILYVAALGLFISALFSRSNWLFFLLCFFFHFSLSISTSPSAWASLCKISPQQLILDTVFFNW